MNTVKVLTRYLVENYTPIEQVEILMPKLLQFEIYLIEKRINLELLIKCQTNTVNDEFRYCDQ